MKPRNPGTLYIAQGTRREAVLLLAHGAGAGQTHPFMVRYARGLSARGIDVVTFDFPYMEARRRAPDKAPVLEQSFRDAIRAAVARTEPGATRLFIGGKSMGGRIATYLAAAPDEWPQELPPLNGVIALGYPLKPPGSAGRQDRVSHLFKIPVPVLIVQGTRDSFGGPDEVRAALGDRAPYISIFEVEGGDHSFAVPKSRAKAQVDVDTEIWDAVSAWISRPRTRSGA
jgi:hypothetical protein